MFGPDVSEAKRVNEETVLGGLGDRLLGGWIHPPLYWRYAFVSASILILVTTFSALRGLPRTPVVVGQREKSIRFFCTAGALTTLAPLFLCCGQLRSIFIHFQLPTLQADRQPLSTLPGTMKSRSSKTIPLRILP
jgi:hypothetical protein